LVVSQTTTEPEGRRAIFPNFKDRSSLDLLVARRNHHDLDATSRHNESGDLHCGADRLIGLLSGSEELLVSFIPPGNVHLTALCGVASQEGLHLYDVAEVQPYRLE